MDVTYGVTDLRSSTTLREKGSGLTFHKNKIPWQTIVSLVGFFAVLATTAPGRIRRERQSTGRSSHPREDLSFLPHDVHRGSDPEGVGWWGPGSSGSLRTKQNPRFLGDPEWHKEQLLASRKPFFAGSIALSPLRKGPLSKERPHSTGAPAPHQLDLLKRGAILPSSGGLFRPQGLVTTA